MIAQNMLFDFKAIFLGVFVTTVVLLSSQLAYVLIASYVGEAANQMVWVNQYKDTFWFALSAIAFAVSFFIGGVVVTLAAQKQDIKIVVMNALMVAFIVNTISVFTAAEVSLLNAKAVVLTLINLFSAGYGAYWCVR